MRLLLFHCTFCNLADAICLVNISVYLIELMSLSLDFTFQNFMCPYFKNLVKSVSVVRRAGNTQVMGILLELENAFL